MCSVSLSSLFPFCSFLLSSFRFLSKPVAATSPYPSNLSLISASHTWSPSQPALLFFSLVLLSSLPFSRFLEEFLSKASGWDYLSLSLSLSNLPPMFLILCTNAKPATRDTEAHDEAKWLRGNVRVMMTCAWALGFCCLFLSFLCLAFSITV